MCLLTNTFITNIVFSLFYDKNYVRLQANLSSLSMQLIPNHHFNIATHQRIAAANPLDAHEKMKRLAACNDDKKVGEIKTLFRQLLPSLETVKALDFYDKMAVMRDLGMFLGSLKRHNVEPLRSVPEAEAVLLQIANDTDMPPRDTLLHYSIWNPADEHVRTFTTSFREVEVIKSLQLCIPPLENALQNLEHLYQADVETEEFGKFCEIVVNEMEFLIDAIVSVYRKVPPLYFLEDLRPYYEPVMVAGKSYSGPGAVEIPLFLVDQVLWASNNNRVEYLDMKERGLGNVLPHWRAMYFNLKGQPSLSDKLIEKFQNTDYNTGLQDSKAAIAKKNLLLVDKIYTQLISFRLPHLKIADISYGKPNPQFGKDQQGYGKSILAIILEMMKEKRQKLTENTQKIRNMA